MSETLDFAAIVNERWDELSPKQRAIARSLLDTPSLAAASTARDIAAKVGVDPGTVVRFVQALGFKGFSDLRQQLRHRYLGSLWVQDLMVHQDPHVTESNALEAVLRLDLANLHSTLVNIDRIVVDRLVDTLISGRRVLVVSSGSYAVPGIVLSHHCQAMGYPVEVEFRGGTALTAHLASLDNNAVVFGISFWRGYRETVKAVEWARGQGLETYVLTDTVFSSIARAAAHVLVVPTEGMFFYQSMTAAISVINGLVALVWLRGGQQSQQAMDRMRALYEELGSFQDDLDADDDHGSVRNSDGMNGSD